MRLEQLGAKQLVRVAYKLSVALSAAPNVSTINSGVRAAGRHSFSIRIPLHFLSHLLSLFPSHHSPRRNSLSSAVIHLEGTGLP